MAHTEAAGAAGEAAIGNQRDLPAHALAVDRAGGGEHLAHSRTAFRTLVADHDHVSRLVRAVLDGAERVLLGVETERRTLEAQTLQAGNLHDGTLRRQVALKTHHATRG